METKSKITNQAIGRQQRKASSTQDRMSIFFGHAILARIDRVVPRQGFTSISDFVRYAVRKELDYQRQHTSVPNIIVNQVVRSEEQ